MVRTAFADQWHRLALRGADASRSPQALVDGLLTFRFPFSADSISPGFVTAVKKSLSALPLVLLQLLDRHAVLIELDLVAEIAAVMLLDEGRLLLSEHFLLERRLFDTVENPVFPYGLPGVLLHELCHWLDWHLLEGSRLSGLATFQSAFRQDVAAIPPEKYLNHEERLALCEQHGGYFSLPAEERACADLALFVHQEEETFCDAFVALMLGVTRPAVAEHFPRSVQAVGATLDYYLSRLTELRPVG